MSKKTFISFSDLPVTSMKSSLIDNRPGITGRSTEVDTSDVSPVYTGGDSELSMLSKKLLKKDTITRIKALCELTEAFKVCW